MHNICIIKRIAIVFAVIMCSTEASAQYDKWIIEFKDKHNSPYAISNPSVYLSQRAIIRRNRFNIAVDSTDLPVNPSYISQVLNKGQVTYLSQSKWLNQILIYCTSTATINAIKTLPFVKNANPASNILKPIEGEHVFEKFNETIEPLQHTEKNQDITDTFNYGNSFKQVHIHNGEFLHKKGFTGKGVIIALLDAGFNKFKTIKAFDSARANGQILGEKDFVDYDNSVNEDDTHGEYCLSTIAANVPGVMVGTAPKASFWLIRSEDVYSEYPVEEHNWVAAAEFSDSAGADMISSSLGYYRFDDPTFDHTYSQFYKNATIVSKGATSAARKGMIVTNSAGNEGGNSWKYIIYPSDADSVCAVAATDVNGNIAYFSSYGYPGAVKPNIASVGSGTTVYTAYGVGTSSGTSFSNPNINGLIACLWQAFPKYDNITILKAVYASGDRATNPDNRYGYGIPNMMKAYRILKRKQNQETYGTDWLFASPDTFTSEIGITLIGQVDGDAVLNLTDIDGNILSTIHLVTEMEEVYDTTFAGLDYLQPGTYNIVYADSLQVRNNTSVLKAGIQNGDWLKILPNPFHSEVRVNIIAQESGKASVKLVDESGRTVQSKELLVSEGTYYQVSFSGLQLSGGVYFIQYNGATINKVIKALKQ